MGLINAFLQSRFSTIALFIALVVYSGWVYWYADKECKETIIVQAAETAEKRKEIASNPPSAERLTERLLDGSY